MPGDIWGKETEKTDVRHRRKTFHMSGSPESPVVKLTGIFIGVIPGRLSDLMFHLTQAQPPFVKPLNLLSLLQHGGYFLLPVSPTLPLGIKTCLHHLCGDHLFSRAHYPPLPSTCTDTSWPPRYLQIHPGHSASCLGFNCLDNFLLSLSCLV